MTTIFYIEDSPIAQRIVERVLESRYTVIIATDGIEAVQKGKEITPDLVLTDLNLPGLNGYEVATSLKSMWPDTPIVALTADKTDRAKRMALIAGCDGCLTKPIPPLELLQAVEKYLSGYAETLPDTPEIALEKLAYQRGLVTRLESQVLALTEVNKQLKAIHEVTQAITESLDLTKIIESALDNLLNAAYIDYIAIFLYHAETDTIACGGHRNFSQTDLDRFVEIYNQRLATSFVRETVETKETQVIIDLHRHPVINNSLMGEQLANIASGVSLPLIVKDKIVAVVQVGTEQRHRFTENELSILDLIGRQLATAIEKAQIHQDLLTAYDELHQLDKLKNQFILIASHELRTPLTILMGYVSLLQQDIDERNKDIVDTVFEQSHTLKTLIDRMLDVNRLEHNDYLAEFAEADINEVVEKIVRKMRPLAANKSLILNFKPEPNVTIVDLDNLQFETILTNLIDNAIRFTLIEGVITISVHLRDSYFDVAVEDNGIGMSEDEQRRVFDKFYQAQNPFDRKHGGVGLGLSIAKDMAAVCGGTILLKSSLGQGAVFTYRQPIKIDKTTSKNQ